MNRSADLRTEASQPEHLLTKSNVALKAARESAADAKDAKKTAEDRAVSTTPAVNTEGADVNSLSHPSPSSPHTQRPALAPNPHPHPVSSPSTISPLPHTVGAAPHTTLSVLQTVSENRPDTPAQSERTGSFASGGYVHLGPVQTSEEVLNDRASRSSGSKLRGQGSGKSKGKRRGAGEDRSGTGSLTSASVQESASGSMFGGRSVAGSGSGPKGYRKEPNGTGSRSTSSRDSIAVDPAPFPLHLPPSRMRLLSGGAEGTSPNGSDGVKTGVDRINNNSPFNGYEPSVSTSASGAEADSLLSQSIPEEGPLEQLEREMFNRSVENLTVPGMALGNGVNDSAVEDEDEDDPRELSPGVDADDDDRERESMGDASGHSGSSDSLFGYPKTARFQHVETENGASALYISQASSVFLVYVDQIDLVFT